MELTPCRASKAEQVLDALKALLETVPGASVERNSVLPENVPAGGLIILRDGDPGEPEQALSGFGSTYYQHTVEIEVYLEVMPRRVMPPSTTSSKGVGAALEADPSLGGLVFGLTYGRPEPSIEAVAGASAIKTATLAVTVTTRATHLPPDPRIKPAGGLLSASTRRRRWPKPMVRARICS